MPEDIKPDPDAKVEGTPTPQDATKGTPTPVEDPKTGDDKKPDAPAEGDSKTGDATVTTKPADKKPPFWQNRIDDLTTEKYALKKQLEESETTKAALLSKLTSTGDTKPTSDTTAKPLDPAEVERIANERAKVISAQTLRQKEFDEKCNSVWKNGKDNFPDWEDGIKNLSATGAFDMTAHPEFLSNVIELEDAPTVVHHLGQNPEDMARILKLSPTRQAIELTRLENTLKTPKAQVSATPEPLKTVKGSAKTDFDPDDPKQSMDEWLAWRNGELAKKKAR